MERCARAGKLAGFLTVISSVLVLTAFSAFSSPEQIRPEAAVQLGHSDSVRTMAFSPDGKWLGSAGVDKAAKVWDLESGREMTTVVPGDELIGAFFSFEGKSIWTVEVNGEMRLWDIGTGRTTGRLAGGSPVTAAACTPDRKYLMLAVYEKLELWNLVTKKKSFEISLKPGFVRDLAFSADGETLALVMNGMEYPEPENIVQIFDLKRRALTRLIRGEGAEFYSVALSPDGKTVMASSAAGMGDKDEKVRVWDVAGNRLITSIPTGDLVFSLDFSPDGRWAAVGSNSSTQLYDAATWEKKTDVAAHDPAVFTPDSRNLACSSTFEILHGISSLVVGIRLVDVETGTLVKKLARNAEWSTEVMFGPGGDEVRVTGVRRSAWNLRSGTRTQGLFFTDTQGNTAYTNGDSPDQTLAVQKTDKGLRIWDTVTGQMIHTFPAETSSSVSEMRFSHSGRYLVTGTWGGELHLWDMAQRTRILTFAGKHKNMITALAFDPDDRLLYSASDSNDDTIKVWNAATGALVHNFKTERSVTALETSSDGTLLMVAGFTGKDHDVDVLNASSGAKVRSFRGHANVVNTLALSHDGKFVVSTDFDARVKLWDLSTATEIRSFYGHAGHIDSLAFSKDDRRMVTTSRDGTTRIWDVQQGRELARFVSFADGEWIAMTPEGYYNASDRADAYVNVRMGRRVYGIENFREAFFRPDLVQVSLSGGSLRDFMGIADVKQPPSVNFLDTPETVDTDRVTVKLQVRDNGGGIGDIRLYLNGTAVALDSRALKRVAPEGGDDLVRTYEVALSSGDNILKALAFNEENTAQGQEAVLKILSSAVPVSAPSLHALVIGIDEFANPKLKLAYSAADARLFSDTLKQAAGDLFEDVTVNTLTGRETTTRESIVGALKACRNLRPDDVFVFYIASHGTVDDGEYFLITSNVGSLRTERLKTDAIAQNELKELIANIPATKKLILIDTCNAGALGDAIQTAMLTRGMSEDTALKILSRSVGSTILSASTSVQEAIEGYNGHGLFTYVLVQGLKGGADKGSTGFIKTTELADYVDSEVPVLAEKVFKRAQYPTISISGQAFPIGKLRDAAGSEAPVVP